MIQHPNVRYNQDIATLNDTQVEKQNNNTNQDYIRNSSTFGSQQNYMKSVQSQTSFITQIGPQTQIIPQQQLFNIRSPSYQVFDQTFSDRQIYEQELNRGRLLIAQLQKQLILVSPEIDLWRSKYQQKDKELNQLKQQYSETQINKSQGSDETSSLDYIQMKKNLQQKDQDINTLVKINQELQYRYEEQSERQIGSGSDDNKTQMDSKDREIDLLRLEKMRLEKEITALLIEKKSNNYISQKIPTKNQQQKQQFGC